MVKKKEVVKKSGSLQVVLTVLLVGAAFAIGSMWTELRMVKSGVKEVAKEEVVAPKEKAKKDLTDSEWNELLAVEAVVTGDEKADIVLVEFTDYLCSWCKKHHDEAGEMINDEYVSLGKVKHVLIDLPIFDGNDVVAAEAARCANDQGKMSEYRDKLFSSQSEWGRESEIELKFNEYAREMDLDADEFNKCLGERKYREVIANGESVANKLGFSSTPGFVLNKKRIMGYLTVDAFRAVLDQELK